MIERGSGRPEEYKLKDGTVVPGVTTVGGRFKDAGGLIAWAWKEGCEGRKLYERRDQAADAGTLAHGMVEAHIHGLPMPDIPDMHRAACKSAFNAFMDWFDGTKLTIIATEIPLVSETHKFGGTLDAVARNPRGDLCLPDWKSSNSLHVDYLVQVAAYGHLWHENRGEKMFGGFHLCRFSKAHGDFEHRFFPDLSEALELFLLYRRAYDLDRSLKTRVK